ncbi:hypothetical protein NIES25_61740 (plasmid) [Nostoc linckia NIES-25]|nr:hypothetical protein NIES25_61740 [Nostoc linckia NIES-25]
MELGVGNSYRQGLTLVFMEWGTGETRGTGARESRGKGKRNKFNLSPFPRLVSLSNHTPFPIPIPYNKTRQTTFNPAEFVYLSLFVYPHVFVIHLKMRL